MASSDRPAGVTRDKRIIYKISDSRRHLVGPTRLGSLATLYHPNLPHRPVDPTPIHSHLTELVEEDTTSGVPTHESPECVGFVAAGSWGASVPDTDAVDPSHRPHLEGNHPILDAIIEDSHPISDRQEYQRFSYGANPSVLDLIPELQRPESYYYINSNRGPGSSTAIGSSGWVDGLDWGFNSVGTSDQWSGHLKSVLLDVFQPSNDTGFPTILQPRFKKTPGTSAALFVPSVMVSIWRQYSEENEPTCPGVTEAPHRPIVIPNNEDYAAPVSGSKTKRVPLNKGKNAKTASISASTKRTAYSGGASAANQTSRNGGVHNKGQNHDMAGGRLARWLKYVLVGLKKPHPSDQVELQDMSSFLPLVVSPSPSENPETHPELAEESPHGEVTFFHYNCDGTEYTCTSLPITVPPGADSHQRGSETGDELEHRVSNTSSDGLVVMESDSEEEDEEEIIEAVLIQELDHGNCACARFSNDYLEDTEQAESSSFINQPLSNEYTASIIPNGNINGNINGNCLEKDEIDVLKSTLKRRASSIRRIPKIIRNKKKKVSFAVRSPNDKHRPKILGLVLEDHHDGDEKTCHKRTGKHRRWRRETYSTDDCMDEPFEWPDNYISVKAPPRWTPPRNDQEADAYISVAARYVPVVYAKLYIQVSSMTHLCELKTHLLICVFRSFFTTTEGLHINWVMSLQSHVYNLLYMDVARVRFRRESQGRPCRACLLLSQDATTLVRHKRCSLLTTVTDILQIAPEELLVMEKGQRAEATRKVSVWEES